PGLRSAAILRSYLREILCQIPDRSGLPLALRGAGAVRSGLPSAVRGMPGVGRFTHCACRGAVHADNMIAKTTVFMRTSSEQPLLPVSCWPDEIFGRILTQRRFVCTYRCAHVGSV